MKWPLSMPRAGRWRGSGEVAIAEVYKKLAYNIPATHFTGYDHLEEGDATILAILHNGQLVDHASAGEKVEVIVDVTPFLRGKRRPGRR